MRLYHFTCLLWLPRILREGITIGEVPCDPTISYDRVLHAANLTACPDAAEQRRLWARGGPSDKTKIRLTVEVLDSQLTSFRQFKERYRIPERYLKALVPYEVRRHWYYVFGGVKPEQIREVAIRVFDQYRLAGTQEVRALVALIESEAAEHLIIKTAQSGRIAGAATVALKQGSWDSWLLDDPHFRAQQFGGLAPAYPWNVAVGSSR